MSEAETFKDQGNSALKRGNWAEAVEFYKKAIKLDSTNAKYYGNLSVAYLLGDEVENAIQAANNAIRCDPKWFKGYSNKGTALWKRKSYDEAIETYETGLKQCPGDVNLIERLREAKEHAGKPSTASSSSSSSYSSTSSPSSLKDYVYNNGDFVTIKNTLQATLRFLILFNMIYSIFGSRSSWLYALYMIIVNCLISLYTTHGKPQFNKEYASKIALDGTFSSFFFAIVLLGMDPFIIGIFPAISCEMLHLVFWLGGLLDIVYPSYTAQVGLQVVPQLAKALQDPSFPTKSTSMKWQIVGLKTVELNAYIEVGIGIYFIFKLLTPSRNIMGLIFFWQYLRMRYLISNDTKNGFRQWDMTILQLVTHNYCPKIVATGYYKLRDLLSSFGKAPDANSQSQMPSMPKCTIM